MEFEVSVCMNSRVTVHGNWTESVNQLLCSRLSLQLATFKAAVDLTSSEQRLLTLV